MLACADHHTYGEESRKKMNIGSFILEMCAFVGKSHEASNRAVVAILAENAKEMHEAINDLETMMDIKDVQHFVQVCAIPAALHGKTPHCLAELLGRFGSNFISTNILVRHIDKGVALWNPAAIMHITKMFGLHEESRDYKDIVAAVAFARNRVYNAPVAGEVHLRTMLRLGSNNLIRTLFAESSAIPHEMNFSTNPDVLIAKHVGKRAIRSCIMLITKMPQIYAAINGGLSRATKNSTLAIMPLHTFACDKILRDISSGATDFVKMKNPTAEMYWIDRFASVGMQIPSKVLFSRAVCFSTFANLVLKIDQRYDAGSCVRAAMDAYSCGIKPAYNFEARIRMCRAHYGPINIHQFNILKSRYRMVMSEIMYNFIVTAMVI